MTLEKSRIYSRAPLRLDLLGGTTDVPPFSHREGGYVINAAIRPYAEVVVVSRTDSRVTICPGNAADSAEFDNMEQFLAQEQLPLVQAAVRWFNHKEGVDIFLSSRLRPGSGLGLSSALMVALINALHLMKFGICIEPMILAEDATTVERDLLGNLCGGQDQYASALGGWLEIEFSSKRTSPSRLDLSAEKLRLLESSLVLCYTGQNHVSGNILAAVMKRYSDGDEQVAAALRSLKRIAKDCRGTLLAGDIATFGTQLGLDWDERTRLLSGISNPGIERIVDIARSHTYRAYGAKVMGAGGGGYALVALEPGARLKLVDTLNREGIETLAVSFVQDGVQTWFF